MEAIETIDVLDIKKDMTRILPCGCRYNGRSVDLRLCFMHALLIQLRKKKGGAVK